MDGTAKQIIITHVAIYNDLKAIRKSSCPLYHLMALLINPSEVRTIEN